MTNEDKISFANFHDEIDNQSFMGDKPGEGRNKDNVSVSPNRKIMGSAKSSFKADLRASQSMMDH